MMRLPDELDMSDPSQELVGDIVLGDLAGTWSTAEYHTRAS